MPSNCDWEPENNDGIKMFFEWSEKGKHKDIVGIPTYKPEGRSYFHALVWGKKRAYMHAHELYEPGVMSMDTPYASFIDKTTPREVVDFLKKEMFKGIDSEIIEAVYVDKD